MDQTGAERSPALPLQVGLVALLLLSTLGEGGAADLSLLLWHGLLALLVVLAIWLPTGSLRTRPDPMLSAGLTAFMAVALAGAVLAPDRYSAWLTLLEIGAFMATVWLAGRCGEGQLIRLQWFLLAGGTIQAVLALSQKLLPGLGRPAGTFLNPNHLGGWLAVTLVFAWSLPAGSRRGLALRVAASVPIGAALISTGSRGALLGLLAGGALAGAFGWRRLSPVARRGLLGAGAVVIVLGAGLVAMRVRQPDPFLYQRARIWKSSLMAVVEHPAVGTGPGQFAAASRRLQFPDGDGPLRFDRGFYSPHSDWVRVVAEFGLPGGLAVLLVLLALTRRIGRSPEACGPTVAGRAALAALAALIVHSAVSNLSHRPALYLLAAVLIGCQGGAVPCRAAADRRRWSRVPVTLLLVLVYVVGDVGPYLAWRTVRTIEPGRLDPESRARLHQALRLNPIHPRAWLRRAEDVAGDGSDWDLAGYAVARDAAERAQRLDREDADVRRVLARIEALACRTLFRDTATRERAHAGYLAAERLAPHDPFIPVELAAFLLETGDPAGAGRAAERALSIEPESVVPRLLLAASILETGEPSSVAEARRLLAEAAERSERWSAWTDQGQYAEKLLTAEPGVLARVRAGIERSEGDGS